MKDSPTKPANMNLPVGLSPDVTAVGAVSTTSENSVTTRNNSTDKGNVGKYQQCNGRIAEYSI